MAHSNKFRSRWFRAQPAQYRLESRLTPDHETGCLIWTGNLIKKGYGTIRVDGKGEYVHRLAWLLSGREIPPGKCLLHSCDRPNCCAIAHLSVGTKPDNSADMARKGRGSRSKLGRPYGAVRVASGRWRAKVKALGRHVALGTYDTAEEASAVALAYKRSIYGDPGHTIPR